VATLQDVARSIAVGVRAGRAARGWTLDELAGRSGVSRRMIVQIEQGQANPSIAILLRISDALGVGLPQLTAVAEAPALHVVRAGSAPMLWRGQHGGHAQLVVGSHPPDVLELWDWTLHPGDAHASEAHSRGTIEQLLVVHGEVELEVDGQRIVLLEGDAAAFSGDRPHCYAASDQAPGPARFTLSVLQPAVGTDNPPAPAIPR
jgi:DNA-binding XRE family transcriptional regulator